MQTPPNPPVPPVDALERQTCLQTLTAALSKAVTMEQVADAILAYAAAVAGADAGAVADLCAQALDRARLHDVMRVNDERHRPQATMPAPAAASTSSTPERAPAPAYRILVADDNHDAADSLAMVLRLQGHEVCVAHDGQEALVLAAQVRPEAAFLDIGMLQMNGYECCRSLRQEPWGLRMLLVAVTGWGQEEDKRTAREAGFDHHLTKPAAPADLERVLGEVGKRA